MLLFSWLDWPRATRVWPLWETESKEHESNVVNVLFFPGVCLHCELHARLGCTCFPALGAGYVYYFLRVFIGSLCYVRFASLRSLWLILKNSRRHLLNQSDAKWKPITTWLHAFSRPFSSVTLRAPRRVFIGWLCCIRSLSLTSVIDLVFD